MSIGVALVIGDEHTLSRAQEESLADAGISVAHADKLPSSGVTTDFDVVLADVPGKHSDTADRLHALAIDIPLILLADDQRLSDAYAMAGDAAFDCLPRSVAGSWLTRKVYEAVQQSRAKRDDRSELPAPVGAPAVLAGVKDTAALIGNGPAMERLRRQIAEAARANMPVMIHGETGTGKDVVARLIHEASRTTRSGSFIKVNCPAFPEAMLEEELFGRPIAAGMPARPGRVELAARGTLLLDEVAELGAAVQARLLDVLEPAAVADVRVIATTGLSPDALYNAGRFRRDLYFRLNGYTIELSPLRDHPEDIQALSEFFLEKYRPLSGGRQTKISPHALAKMTQYGWPGNIRELESAVKRYVVTGDEHALTSTFFEVEQPLDDHGQGDRYHESERRVILSALSETRWNRRKAAKLLGISYNTLRRRIQRYSLDTHAVN